MRHESRALADARAQLARRRAADVRNEREVAVLTQARLVDAADLDSMRARLDAAEALAVRVGQVEQQSMIIERLYRQVGDLRGKLADGSGSGLVPVTVPSQALAPDSETPSEMLTDVAAEGPGGDAEPAGADTAGPDTGNAGPAGATESPRAGERALADSVDITAFEAANRIANGVPRARAAGTRRQASLAADHDDLTAIEGIGPRIQSLCLSAGISTFQVMAETPVERLREILMAAGPRYVGHQPQTWPEQAAALAAGGSGHSMAQEARAG